jgi:hypothetical protein
MSTPNAANSDDDAEDRTLDTVPADQDDQDDREAADPTPDERQRS